MSYRKAPLTSTSKSVPESVNTHTEPPTPNFAITEFGIVSPATKFKFDAFGCGVPTETPSRTQP